MTTQTLSGGSEMASSGISRSPAAHNSANRRQDRNVRMTHPPEIMTAASSQSQKYVAGMIPQRNLRVGGTLI